MSKLLKQFSYQTSLWPPATAVIVAFVLQLLLPHNEPTRLLIWAGFLASVIPSFWPDPADSPEGQRLDRRFVAFLTVMMIVSIITAAWS